MYNFRSAKQLNDKLTLAYPAKTYSAEHRLSDIEKSVPGKHQLMSKEKWRDTYIFTSGFQDSEH